MNTILAVFLTLPTILEAKIEIQVRASNNTRSTYVRFYGNIVTVVDDEDLKGFLITEKKLYAAIKKFTNVDADNVYLKSPTPWGDLYKKFNWEEVYRTIEPINAIIVSKVPSKQRIYSHIFNNTLMKHNPFKARMRNRVLSTLFSSWEVKDYSPSNAEINYVFDVEAKGVTDKHIFEYTSQISERVIKSQYLSVGLQKGVNFLIDHNLSVITELYAIRWDLKIKIIYSVKLEGTVAINFAKPYEGHHFWSQDLNILLHNKKQAKKRYVIEIITFIYYTDPEIIVKDSSRP